MKNKKLLAFLAAGTILVLLAVSGVLAWKYYQVTQEQKNSPQSVSQRIISKVGSIYALPSGEEPTVALIQDKNKLENQEFFSGARNGDYLLIYTKAKVALVYRESTNKLINVGPVNIPGTDSTSEATAETKNDETASEQSR